MKIGIDIDETLNETKEKMIKAAYEYAISLNKKINEEIELIDKNNDASCYKEKFGFTNDELKYFFGTIQEKIAKEALPRPNSVNVLEKLSKKGFEIYIITARESTFHEDPYKLSKNWLDKHNIYYDHLIVNAKDKGKICFENNISFLVDDNIYNCLSAIKNGVFPIFFNGFENDKNISFSNDWLEVYEIINERVKKDVK